MQNYLIGPLLNGAAIIIAVVIASATKKNIPAQQQGNLRVILGACIVWFGLKLTWSSLSGSFGFWLKQFATVMLAMVLGKIIGRILRLQKLSNSIGRFANAKMEQAMSKSSSAPRNTFEDGFLVATALFCVAPLAILASVQSGLEQSFSPIFIVKAVMDALAAMAFAATFGWSIAVSAIPGRRLPSRHHPRRATAVAVGAQPSTTNHRIHLNDRRPPDLQHRTDHSPAQEN